MELGPCQHHSVDVLRPTERMNVTNQDGADLLSDHLRAGVPHNTLSDLELISRDLIEAFGLRYSEDVPHLSDPLLRWLDFRERYIEPRPRELPTSGGFEARVPLAARSALAHFMQLARNGADLNPYLSRRSKTFDVSGQKSQWRTDALWADWGITHAHLTEAPIAENMELSESSDWLLFFIASPDVLALIDVRPHSEEGVFQAVDLVEKAFRSWPDYATRFEINVVQGEKPNAPPEAIARLRKGGVNQTLQIDGKTYIPPGLGMTSASTAMRMTLMRDRLVQNANLLARDAADPSSWIHQQAIAKGILNPTFRLVVDGDSLGRQAGNTVWNLPRNVPVTSAQFFVQDRMLPPWAAERLVAWRATQNK